MSTHAALSGRATRRWITGVGVLNAIAAAAGAVAMALGGLGLQPSVESRLPWGSPVVGGVALVACVAVPNAVLAVLSVQSDDRTAPAAIGVGLLLVAWIVVELAFIRELSFFHPFYVGVGMVLVHLGRRLREITGGPTRRVRDLRQLGSGLQPLPRDLPSRSDGGNTEEES